jgi:hypothetical protein
MSGFFKIERDFLTSTFWLSEPFTKPQAWVDLIGLANYADKTKYYKSTFQKIKRGQIVTSKQALAERWKWSKHKVHAFLRTLEAAEMVTIESTTKGTLLTIVNYAMYQDAGNTKGTQKGARRERVGNAEGTLRDPQEEYREEKEIPSVYIPTRADISAYVSEEGLRADPDAIFDYYESVGWEINGKPIKDWRAVCRRWKQYDEPKKESQEEHDAEVNRLLDILEKGGSIYDTTGSS